MALRTDLNEYAVALTRDAQQRRSRLSTAVRELQPFEEALAVAAAGPLERGHAMVDALNDALARFEQNGGFRSDAQVHIHAMFTSSCARLLYGTETFEQHELAIRERNGWTPAHMNQWVYVQMPRRNGKTWSVSMHIIALMVTVPCIKIAVFAPALYQSQLMLESVAELLHRHFPRENADVTKKRIKITKGKDGADVRMLTALPAASNTGTSFRPFFSLSLSFSLATRNAKQTNAHTHTYTRMCVVIRGPF